jgi:hypothetical protein
LETHLLNSGFIFSENKTDGPMVSKYYIKKGKNAPNEWAFVRSRITIGNVENIIVTYNMENKTQTGNTRVANAVPCNPRYKRGLVG